MRQGKAQKAISKGRWESEGMGAMRFSELHCREVINLCDGARLGEVCDLVFDPVCGQITALVVPGPVSYTHLDVYKRQVLAHMKKIEFHV